MQAINHQDWQSLPESAQREIYDFFLFIRQRYQQNKIDEQDKIETIALSNHSANLITDWQCKEEDDIWT